MLAAVVAGSGLFLFARSCSIMAMDAALLQTRANSAGQRLEKGCVILGTQLADGTVTYSAHGHQQPEGIPPEKVICELGSISKVFTGMLLAQAVAEKKVTFTTTLKEVMGAGQSFADPRVGDITLEQLATHTSGLPRIPAELLATASLDDPYAQYDRQQLDGSLSRVKLAHQAPFPPSYSNLGVGLLGDLLSRIYGKSWEELVVERLARPLGMVDTCVTLTDEQKKRLAPAYKGGTVVKHWHHQALAGSGALVGTAEDLMKLGRALARPETSPIKETIIMTEQPRMSTGYGLCLPVNQIGNRTQYWYQGGTGGFGSWISAIPQTGEIVVMLINNSDLKPEEVLLGKAGHTTPQAQDASLTEYAGVYDTGVKAGSTSIYYTFEVRGGALWMQVTGQEFLPLTRHAKKEDRFVFAPLKAEIQFSRKAGKIVAATLYQNGVEYLAKRMK